MLYTSFALVAATLVSAATIPSRNSVDSAIRPRAGGDPPFQQIPTTAQADNTYSNGKPLLAALPPYESQLPAPDVYGVRSIDLPFNRLYHGKMKFFKSGQLNTPDGITDRWLGEPGAVDSAKQSACGIPDNAFSISKVAIHPYFLKYAPLSRYCMQDVCISFWNGKTGPEQSDMMLKVTDICSTDPKDPTHCAKPGDIKVDRTKVQIMEHLTDAPTENYPQLMGNEFTDGESYWFFTKCWADGLIQPAYTDNWFARPHLPNNLKWSQDTAYAQWKANNASYPLHNPPLPTYDNNAYNPRYDDVTSPPIPDWSPSDPDPEWCPVAGGKGWGIPTGKNCGGSQQNHLASEGSSSTSKVASSFGASKTSTSTTSTTPVIETTTSQAVASSTTKSQIAAMVTPSSSTLTTPVVEISTSQAMVSSASEALVASTVSSSSTSSSTAALPSISPLSNATTGMSSGLNAQGQANSQQGGQVENDDADGDVCDAEEEPEEDSAQPSNEGASGEEDEDDTCEPE